MSTQTVRTHRHVQRQPSDMWVVKHRLRALPEVSVQLRGPGKLLGYRHDSRSRTRVFFDRPARGEAVCVA